MTSIPSTPGGGGEGKNGSSIAGSASVPPPSFSIGISGTVPIASGLENIKESLAISDEKPASADWKGKIFKIRGLHYVLNDASGNHFRHPWNRVNDDDRLLTKQEIEALSEAEKRNDLDTTTVRDRILAWAMRRRPGTDVHRLEIELLEAGRDAFNEREVNRRVREAGLNRLRQKEEDLVADKKESIPIYTLTGQKSVKETNADETSEPEETLPKEAEDPLSTEAGEPLSVEVGDPSPAEAVEPEAGERISAEVGEPETGERISAEAGELLLPEVAEAEEHPPAEAGEPSTKVPGESSPRKPKTTSAKGPEKGPSKKLSVAPGDESGSESDDEDPILSFKEFPEPLPPAPNGKQIEEFVRESFLRFSKYSQMTQMINSKRWSRNFLTRKGMEAYLAQLARVIEATLAERDALVEARGLETTAAERGAPAGAVRREATVAERGAPSGVVGPEKAKPKTKPKSTDITGKSLKIPEDRERPFRRYGEGPVGDSLKLGEISIPKESFKDKKRYTIDISPETLTISKEGGCAYCGCDFNDPALGEFYVTGHRGYTKCPYFQYGDDSDPLNDEGEYFEAGLDGVRILARKAAIAKRLAEETKKDYEFSEYVQGIDGEAEEEEENEGGSGQGETTIVARKASERDSLVVKVDALTVERDALRKDANNKTKEKDDLQKRIDDLTAEVGALRQVKDAGEGGVGVEKGGEKGKVIDEDECNGKLRSIDVFRRHRYKRHQVLTAVYSDKGREKGGDYCPICGHAVEDKSNRRVTHWKGHFTSIVSKSNTKDPGLPRPLHSKYFLQKDEFNGLPAALQQLEEECRSGNRRQAQLRLWEGDEEYRREANYFTKLVRQLHNRHRNMGKGEDTVGVYDQPDDPGAPESDVYPDPSPIISGEESDEEEGDGEERDGSVTAPAGPSRMRKILISSDTTFPTSSKVIPMKRSYFSGGEGKKGGDWTKKPPKKKNKLEKALHKGSKYNPVLKTYKHPIPPAPLEPWEKKKKTWNPEGLPYSFPPEVTELSAPLQKLVTELQRKENRMRLKSKGTQQRQFIEPLHKRRWDPLKYPGVPMSTFYEYTIASTGISADSLANAVETADNKLEFNNNNSYEEASRAIAFPSTAAAGDNDVKEGGKNKKKRKSMEKLSSSSSAPVAKKPRTFSAAAAGPYPPDEDREFFNSMLYRNGTTAKEREMIRIFLDNWSWKNRIWSKEEMMEKLKGEREREREEEEAADDGERKYMRLAKTMVPISNKEVYTLMEIKKPLEEMDEQELVEWLGEEGKDREEEIRTGGALQT